MKKRNITKLKNRKRKKRYNTNIIFKLLIIYLKMNSRINLNLKKYNLLNNQTEYCYLNN